MHPSQSKVLSFILYPVFRYFEYLSKHNPEKLTKIRYWLRFHKKLDLENPKDINEKILWLKFHSDMSVWGRLSDKYAVRGYLEEFGLGSMLNELYAKWDTIDEIDLNVLPDSFVLKCNNGSGGVIVVPDKLKFDIVQAKKELGKYMGESVGTLSAEMQYSNIKPCIIAEKYLPPPIGGKSIIDYKVWCFNGEPNSVWVCSDRIGNSTYVALFDLDWNFHPEYSVFNSGYRMGNGKMPRPVSLELMLDACRKLSKPFPCVRIDLYEIDGKPLFGEFTFTSLGGMMDFYTPEYMLAMGDLIKLPRKEC